MLGGGGVKPLLIIFKRWENIDQLISSFMHFLLQFRARTENVDTNDKILEGRIKANSPQHTIVIMLNICKPVQEGREAE